MIITCPNCNKQFKIDNSLIPDDGRDLQCGSCNHVWFYKLEEENNEILKLNELILNKDIKIKSEKKEKKIKDNKKPLEKIRNKINNEKNEKISENQKNKTSSKNISNKGSKFLSYLVVFVISFVTLIILTDTLKIPLINVFPGLEIVLFNLFETLQDLKLFIIDLF